jgi:hypothetical protein
MILVSYKELIILLLLYKGSRSRILNKIYIIIYKHKYDF